MSGNGTVVDAPYEGGIGYISSVFICGCLSEVGIGIHG